MLLDGLVLGSNLGLHHAGDGANPQGSTHQAGQGGVEGSTGEGEDIGGD